MYRRSLSRANVSLDKVTKAATTSTIWEPNTIDSVDDKIHVSQINGLQKVI